MADYSSSSYVYCDHCKEKVSKSTFRRHLNLQTRQEATSSCDFDMDCDLFSFETTSSGSESNLSVPGSTENMAGAKRTLQDTSKSAEQYLNTESDNNTDVSDSDQESCSDTNEKEDVDNQEGDIDDYADEHWEETCSNTIDFDNSSTPLPEPVAKKTKLKEVNSLVFWLVYLLLLWQTLFKVSDNGLAWILQLFIQFLKVAGIETTNTFLVELATLLPSSLYMMHRFIGLEKDGFTKYVVCPKCTKLYSFDSCLHLVKNKTVAKTCSNTYTFRRKTRTCDSPLVKRVVLKDNKEKFYPIKLYCYNGVINELERILQCNNIPEQCETWRTNQQTDDTLTDVYSGRIWKEFQSFKGRDFLKAPRSLGFMLNFDYFQPIKHRKDYSVGVIYLALLNLPREIRFKWENILVVGIIPSMDGEPKNLNKLLHPAIEELQCLWKGLRLKSSFSSIPLMFRAAVLCIAADVPAARKLCGFKSHSAFHGCSRCLKSFPGSFAEKNDYSGFDRDTWPKRSTKEHRRAAKKIENCKKTSKRKEMCRDYGINYWSPLLDLEYFDIVRFCTIDPMHNLFLGTAKHMFKIWDNKDILGKKQMKEIEKRIEEMDVPSNIGRLPKKITSNYGCYTAEQWKNWTLIYSIFALKDIIEENHFKCWQSFVLACQYMCRTTVTHQDLERADILLLKFCRQFEQLYGKKAVTPNMHLHCHLRDVILDHGPVYSFWCFGFERYNGIMGSVKTNKRSLELQLMRKLMMSRYLDSIQLPSAFEHDFKALINHGKSQLDNNALSRSIVNFCKYKDMSTMCPTTAVDWSVTSKTPLTLPAQYKMKHFDSADLDILQVVYKSLYPNKEIAKESMSETIKTYSSVSIGGEQYGSKLDCRTLRTARIYASWAADDQQLNLDHLSFFAGKVHYYFSHSLKLDGNYITHVFALVTWFKPDNCPDQYGNPTKTWKLNDFVEGGPACFMPVQRIHCKYAAAEVSVKGEQKLVTVPLQRGQYSPF